MNGQSSFYVGNPDIPRQDICATIHSMRASRLLSILMLLQLRGRQTAESLAAEFEVSVRTIYRDVDELSASGVPVISDRGPGGGFVLRDGYQTKLTGLGNDEAEAMLMVGMPDAAVALGLGQAATTAGRKLLASLPDAGREGATRIGERFHLDPVDWYRDSDVVPQLPTIARAVLDGRVVTMKYESWSGLRAWRIEPQGLVLKAGAWYLVGRGTVVGEGASAGSDKASKTTLNAASIRTFKVANICEHTVLDESFARPPDFNLAQYWRSSVMRFEAGLRPGRATLRASKEGLRRLAELGAFAAQAVAKAEIPHADKQGWATLQFPIENYEHAARQLIGIGAEAEVLEPIELREAICSLAARMIEMHTTKEAAHG
jgi:predicted DNA-binding transcriptional regulator YafY